MSNIQTKMMITSLTLAFGGKELFPASKSKARPVIETNHRLKKDRARRELEAEKLKGNLNEI